MTKGWRWRLLLLLLLKWTVDSKETLRVGFLFQSQTNFPIGEAPGLSLAIEDYQAAGGLPNHTVEVLVRPNACDAMPGTVHALDLHEKHHIDVLLGPACSTVCIPASYYYSYWNLAIFSEACTSALLDDKDTHDILIRVMPSYSKVGPAFTKLFKYYGWKRAVLITPDAATYCEYGAAAIREDFLENNITIAEFITIPAKGTMTSREIDSVLLRIQSRGRIVIFCRSKYYGETTFDDQFMTRAHALGMTKGDYVFFTYGFFPPLAQPWTLPADATEQQIQERTEQFFVFKKITLADLAGPHVDVFRERVMERGLTHPWNYSVDAIPNNEIEWGMFLYDATLLYLTLAAEILEEGGDPSDGRLLFHKSVGRTFQGMTGHVLMNDKADREPNYWLWQVKPEKKELLPYAEIRINDDTSMQELIFTDPVYWRTPDGKAPIDTPPCGFRSERCPTDKSGEDTIVITTTVVGFIFFVAVAIGLYYIRQKRIEEEILQMTWKVKHEDIEYVNDTAHSKASSRSLAMSSLAAHSQFVDYSFDVGFYKGVTVVVRKYDKQSVVLSKRDLVELKAMRELSHENINPFIGACVDAPNICSLGQHCPKGSLRDVLENDDIKLDWLFKQSIISDMAKGMAYLHTSQVKSHGRLKSSCCLVDSRWTMKITSFGLHAFRDGEKDTKTAHRRDSDRLWTAPELLRMDSQPRYGTQKGDVYSFGIILQEVVFRASPFFADYDSPKETIQRLVKLEDPPFRPELPHNGGSEQNGVVSLMQECWTEKPEARPTFDDIRKRLRTLNKGRKGNIMDNMVQMLEKYANNLEDIVQQRTAQLMEEKRKTDSLLYRMLPPSVAERLKTGKAMDAELFESVTIYFSDIVGFTSLSSLSTPMEVVNLLNDLYSVFDGTIAKHDVYKVETIGDAYMVVSGVPRLNGNRHVAEIANMALDLLVEVTKFKIKHMPERILQLRIGMHTGSCAAGVVGLTMPRYCLFGDTVNMASRMESNGEASRIHLSQHATEYLISFPGYVVERRGQMEVKGKGMQTTYWLLGKKDVPIE